MNHVYSPPWSIWLTDWNWDPVAVTGILTALVFYFGGIYALRRRRQGVHVESHRLLLFVLGLWLFAFAILSPLDELGERYSFTLHMIQHLLLFIPVPLLLLVGIPEWLLAPLQQNRLAELAMRIFLNPFVALIVPNAVFIAWHVPALYDLSLQNHTVHIFEHLTIIGTALLMWWPVAGPLRAYHLSSYGHKVMYLFVLKIPTSLLAALLTFAEVPIYPTYANQTVRLWGLSVMTDQQLSGILMWLPAGLAFLAVLTIIFFRWMSEGEEGTPLQHESMPI